MYIATITNAKRFKKGSKKRFILNNNLYRKGVENIN